MYRLSAMLPSPPLAFESALSQATLAGFTYVDVTALVERPVSHLEALAESGLIVSAGLLGQGLPDDHWLDSPFPTIQRATLELLKSQVADIARLGATYALLAPGNDGRASGMARFTEASCLLAEYAGRRMVSLCIEHVAGSALPSAGKLTEWLDQVGHEGMGLLLNVRHSVMSNEDPAGVIEHVGRQLRYVVLDVRRSEPTENEMLKSLLRALKKWRYDGAFALRTSAGQTMAELRRLVEQLAGEVDGEA